MQARNESLRLKHEYVGTEHMLLALTRQSDAVAAKVLEALSIDLDEVRRKVDATVKHGKASPPGELMDLPYTSRAKKVLELSMGEARDLQHGYVGTEHLLLGLLREEKGIAAQVLAEGGATLAAARAAVLRITRDGGADEPRSHSEASADDEAPRLVPTPRASPYQIAVVALWWTLGLVVLFDSLGAVIHSLNGTAQLAPHLGALAGAEIVGAILFLGNRTLKYGALILLAVFAVAMVAHSLKGEFPAPLLVYTAATVFIFVQRTAGSRVTAQPVVSRPS